VEAVEAEAAVVERRAQAQESVAAVALLAQPQLEPS
jgi:hypothetical protein